VDSVDFKGFYTGTVVDNPPDPDLYRLVLDRLPDAWIEDPHLDEEIQALLEPHRDRVTWDANIHGIADIEALPYPPKMVNVKPSRVGSLPELFATYAYCQERGIAMYGGGQFELGAGRGQIQYLASLYHPDGRTTSPPRASTSPTRRRGCRTARCRSPRSRPAFAGARSAGRTSAAPGRRRAARGAARRRRTTTSSRAPRCAW
jgi:hypothetical protein